MKIFRRADWIIFRLNIIICFFLIPGTFSINAQPSSEPATHSGEDIQIADIKNQMAQLDAEIRQKQSQLSGCARDRESRKGVLDSDIAEFQTRVANDQQEISRIKYKKLLPGETYDPSYVSGLQSEIGRFQSEIFKLQQKKNSISLDHSCENELNAQITQAQNAKWALQSKLNSKLTQPIFNRNNSSAAAPNSGNASDSLGSRSAPWGFGSIREPDVLPPQPPPTTYLDQDGNVVSGPPLNSDLFNNIGEMRPYPRPRRLNVRDGEAPWGFGGPDEDPSVVRYDSAGQPIDADGLAVLYASEAERDYAVANMREQARAADERMKHYWNEQGREYDRQRAAELAGSWFDPFDQYPDNPVADAIEWERATAPYHDKPAADSTDCISFALGEDPATANRNTIALAHQMGVQVAAFRKQAGLDDNFPQPLKDFYISYESMVSKLEADQGMPTYNPSTSPEVKGEGSK